MQRYFGVIDWFGTKDGAKYGFVQYRDKNCSEQKSIFLHKNNILSPSKDKLLKFTEGSVVSFSIQESKKYKDKVDAIDVLLLEDELYPIILEEYLSSHIFLKYSSIGKEIEKLVFVDKNRLVNYKNEILEFIRSIINSEIDNKIEIVVNKFSDFILKENDLLDVIFEKYFLEHIYDDVNSCFYNFIIKNKEFILNYKEIASQSFIFILENKDNDFIKKIFDDFGRFIYELSLMDSLSINTKIKLWFYDFYDAIDIDNMQDLFGFIQNLDNKNQVIFLKKLMYYKKIRKFDFGINDLIVMNFTDYSTRVVLEIIRKICIQDKFQQNNLRNDILKIISESNLVSCANDVLKLEHYFNLCGGRYVEQPRRLGDQIIGYDLVLRDIEFISSNNNNPIVCDGRLSDQLSGGGNNFWWCKNKKCFSNSRSQQEDWNNYSIIDFLNILDIPYQEESIEILYGSINRVNRFLEHLNCKSCNKLLKPNGNSQYTYYRVSSFSCDNEYCENPDINVYISHCSNGRCDGTIDNRNSQQCNNGFVICNECFACCSQEILDRRNENRVINRLPAINWGMPHRGNQILCPNCAGSMNYQNIHQVRENINNVINEFEQLLQINLPENQKLVTRTGVNNGGQRWFVVWQRHYDRNAFINLLHYWQSLGFHIVDFPDNLTRYNYLIVEPSNNTNHQYVTQFYCSQCQLNYDISSDVQRCRSIRHWHSSELNPI